MKVREVTVDGQQRFLFWCPGCKTHMWFELKRWTWNGDKEKPTVSPSILFRSGDATGATCCHLFLTDGNLRFLTDCTHSLAGQTVPLEDVAW
jgi:hypothetical protein